MDPGCYRVLINLFQTLQVDKLEIITKDYQGPTLSVMQLDYPGYLNDIPVSIDRDDELLWKTKGREVGIVYAREIHQEELNPLYEGLEVWTHLLLLGGYAEKGTKPCTSGGLPDGLHLADACTIKQTFSEAFFADEAAFHAIVGFAHSLYFQQHPVATIEIN